MTRPILAKYKVNTAGAEAAGQVLLPLLESWGNGHLKNSDFSGSIAKGTGVSIGTDADIFLSLSSSVSATLADIYNSLYSCVSAAGHPVRKQNVSIGTTVNGYSIDLVPARRQSQYGSDHSLYRRKANSWTKTNVLTHIAYVKNSGRVDEIRILKTWRQLHQLSFPFLFLEMAVIDSLKYAKQGDLAQNVLTVLTHLRDQIEQSRYIDPANSANVISDDCTQTEKRAISAKALESCRKQNWQAIVW